MTDRLRSEDPTPNTAIDLLKQVSAKVKQIESQIDQSFMFDSNPSYPELMRARAQLLIDLPNSLKELTEREIDVPQQVSEWAQMYAMMAQQIIDEDNTFGMSVLLIPKGLEKGDKNQLEKLIEDLEEGSFR